MGKSSSNAGKHSYLRKDKIDELFKKTKKSKVGIKIGDEITNKFVTIVNTNYKDSRGNDLYFGDKVIYHGTDYQIDYDSRNYCWSIKNNTKQFKLSEISNNILLAEKYMQRNNETVLM